MNTTPCAPNKHDYDKIMHANGDRTFICETCGHTWKAGPDPHGPNDRNGIPYCWCCMEYWPCQDVRNEVAKELLVVATRVRDHFDLTRMTPKFYIRLLKAINNAEKVGIG